MAFFYTSFTFSNFYLDFYFPFFLGLLFSIFPFLFGLLFLFGLWTFVFPFLFGLLFSLWTIIPLRSHFGFLPNFTLKINLFYFKKTDGQAFRSSQVQKSAREFSHGLNFSCGTSANRSRCKSRESQLNRRSKLYEKGNMLVHTLQLNNNTVKV